MDENLCQAIEQMQKLLPLPAEIEQLGRAVREAETVSRAVAGKPLPEVETALVRAWIGVMAGEAHALHHALDVLRQHYCQRG